MLVLTVCKGYYAIKWKYTLFTFLGKNKACALHRHTNQHSYIIIIIDHVDILFQL